MSVADLYRNRGVNPLAVQRLTVRELLCYPALHSAPVLSANLISYWRMEGNSNDSWGANNGTDTNITYSVANGKFGQGAGFAGNSIIDCGSNTSLKITGSLTVMAWVKIPPSDAWERIVANYGYASSLFTGYALQVSNAGYVHADACGGKNVSYNETAQITPLDNNTWWHLAFTYDATNGILLYINGAKVPQTRSGTIPASLAASPNNGSIGALNSSGTWYYASNGVKIDEVAIFSGALSAAEIGAYYLWATA